MIIVEVFARSGAALGPAFWRRYQDLNAMAIPLEHGDTASWFLFLETNVMR
jgi:hypothetical protein